MARPKTTLSLIFVSSDHLERTMEFIINDTKYRYYFHDIKNAERCYNDLKRWPGRALSWIKKNSHKVEKVDGAE